MKGIIFREFLDMIEDKYGYELVDQIIIESDVPSKGAYTSVGTYPHSEMVSLLTSLSKQTGISVSELMEIFGQHAFGVFSIAYKNMFAKYHDAFSFLSEVENTIHVEVKKLYPEAELPTIIVKEMDAQKMVLAYKSQRRMAPFALGQIRGCLAHFNEKASISMKDINTDSSEVEFILIKE